MQSTERVIVRGSRQQTELAAWLADQLNQPGGAVIPDVREYKLPADEMVRVFGLMHSQTREQVEDLVTIVRSVADTKLYAIPEALANCLAREDRTGCAGSVAAK